jgi:uncharacterized protein (TIGR02996 family)
VAEEKARAIDGRLLLFVAEQLASPTERQLLRALRDAPTDAGLRGAYGDFLEEDNRPLAADLVRKGWTPGN